MKAQRGSRGIGKGWMFNTTPWPIYPQERDPVPIVQEAGWAPVLYWIGVENFALTRI
jgi:hypothetical protein